MTFVPEIQVHVREKEKDQFLVIACDGIWDVMSNQTCVELVSTLFMEGENDLGLICEEVLDTCLAKGSRHNMTLTVVCFPDSIKGRSNGGGVMKRRKNRERK